MNKDQYFKDLEEIIFDRIYIGSSEEDIHQEIETNSWSIAIQPDIISEITTEELNGFVLKVINDRQTQIKQSTSSRGMLFYLWFDWMASQLRFNLISDLNKKLPFRCDIEFVNDSSEIIDEFLKSPFHNGLPIEGYDDESEEKELILKIYKVHLNKQ